MTILFLCRQNAGRSQMAQAFFERLAPEHEVISAGSHPASSVHPSVVLVMEEIGIDLSGKTPRRVDQAMLDRADHVISMGCDDPAVCDYPGRKVEDWSLEDPSKKPIEDVRRIRDLIRARVESLVERLRSKQNAT
jgi:arsenate reductase